jgi:hypothetical protein
MANECSTARPWDPSLSQRDPCIDPWPQLETAAHWALTQLPSLSGDARPLECVLKRGDLLYFPSSWLHATVNLQDTVFMSSFHKATTRARDDLWGG